MSTSTTGTVPGTVPGNSWNSRKFLKPFLSLRVPCSSASEAPGNPLRSENTFQECSNINGRFFLSLRFSSVKNRIIDIRFLLDLQRAGTLVSITLPERPTRMEAHHLDPQTPSLTTSNSYFAHLRAAMEQRSRVRGRGDLLSLMQNTFCSSRSQFLAALHSHF